MKQTHNKTIIINPLSAGCDATAHIIFYGNKFSDSHDDIMAKLEDYKVFTHKRLNCNYNYNEYAKKNTSDLTRSRRMFLYMKKLNLLQMKIKIHLIKILTTTRSHKKR